MNKKPIRVIVEVISGVAQVYASNPGAIDLAIVDHDVYEIGDANEDDYHRLTQEIESLSPVDYEQPRMPGADDFP